MKPDVSDLGMMAPPRTCIDCGVLIARDGEGWRHTGQTSCPVPAPSEEWRDRRRWVDHLDDHGWANATGRGGTAHIPLYGVPGVAVCGVAVRPRSATHRQACRSCVNEWSHLDYAWRSEQHWKRPYGGSGVNDLVEQLGLRPSATATAKD